MVGAIASAILNLAFISQVLILEFLYLLHSAYKARALL